MQSLELADLSLSINNKVVAFGVLFMYQIVYALYTIAFITHGVSYVDDNTSPSQSPLYIGKDKKLTKNNHLCVQRLH